MAQRPKPTALAYDASVIAALIAAAAAYHGFGRGLSSEERLTDDTLHHPTAEGAKGVLDAINRAGAEAFKITIGAIPLGPAPAALPIPATNAE